MYAILIGVGVYGQQQNSYNLNIPMSRTRTQIQQSLSSIMLVIRLYKTFQLGQLVNICQLLQQDPSAYDEKILARMLTQFIFHINEQNKKNHTDHEYLGLIIVESLIYNLYRYHNKNGINNSIYSNSLMISSSSQIGLNDQSTHSIRHYESIEDHFGGNFITFVQDFIADDELKKKLRQMVERGARKAGDGLNQNHRYTDILLQTVEYILNKDGKLDKNGEFQHIRQHIATKNTSITSHYEKKSLKLVINDVNRIIFSNKLNRIFYFLEDAQPNVYFSLLRVYLGQCHISSDDTKKLGKYYNGIRYGGGDMLINLNWAYIQSIPNKAQLFETPKNPFFKLIQSYLLACFMPTFRQFHQVASKCCKYDYLTPLEFYKVCETTISKDLYEFIGFLPQDLLEYLKQVYFIILKSELKTSKKQTVQNLSSLALMRVKKLLIYSLLAKPILIETYYSQGVDLQKYAEVCNFIINLFFKSSLKKYSHNTEGELQNLRALTHLISGKIDEMIMEQQDDGEYDQFQKTIDIKTYSLEEPILNYDYQTLQQAIRRVQFTPKDEKQFQMHKKSQLVDRTPIMAQNLSQNQNPSLTNTNTNIYAINLGMCSPHESVFSPMHRTKKDSLDFNQSINCLENLLDEVGVSPRDQIDFLTWMAVGGSRDYGTKPFKNRAESTERLKELTKLASFPKQKMKQITNLYQKYKRISL